jgi:hypothetical protein
MKNIASTLENIIQDVWKETNLDKAKLIITTYIGESKIKDEDKNKIFNNLKQITSKFKLDYYMANSLLTYEGKGLGQLSKPKI